MAARQAATGQRDNLPPDAIQLVTVVTSVVAIDRLQDSGDAATEPQAR
jgi:hypothetical protein